jgi:predicted CopG family antitoxin
MNDMKLGVFGDSFADPRSFNERGNFAWPVLLLKDLKLSGKDCYALRGTSHWWSYEQFLKNYKKYDTIVFVHTTAIRWPHLPDAETGRHWLIGGKSDFGDIDELTSPLLKQINPYYVDIFSDELLNFISHNIYKSVNQICADNGIQLINIMPFKNEYETENYGFPILTGLTAISWNERVVVNDTRYTIVEALQLVNDIREHSRYCHLNKSNNRSLSELIKDLIVTKRDGLIDLNSYDCWTTEDDDLNAYYAAKLKEQTDV